MGKAYNPYYNLHFILLMVLSDVCVCVCCFQFNMTSLGQLTGTSIGTMILCFCWGLQRHRKTVKINWSTNFGRNINNTISTTALSMCRMETEITVCCCWWCHCLSSRDFLFILKMMTIFCSAFNRTQAVWTPINSQLVCKPCCVVHVLWSFPM